MKKKNKKTTALLTVIIAGAVFGVFLYNKEVQEVYIDNNKEEKEELEDVIPVVIQKKNHGRKEVVCLYVLLKEEYKNNYVPQ